MNESGHKRLMYCATVLSSRESSASETITRGRDTSVYYLTLRMSSASETVKCDDLTVRMSSVSETVQSKLRPVASRNSTFGGVKNFGGP